VKTAPFPVPATECAAIAEQDRLRPLVQHVGEVPEPLRLIAGLDVAYAVDESQVAGAVTVLDADTLEVVETATALRPVEFPYVPGLLAFREIPALMDALGKLAHEPDVLVCDGYGLAHPRRFGLACHLGVLTDLPTFGVAKTAFIGTYTEPADERGAHSDLVDSDSGADAAPGAAYPAGAGAGAAHTAANSAGIAAGVGSSTVIGRVLRTRPGVKPVFVSTGHRITLDAATDLALRLAPTYRLPETTRQADQACRRALAAAQAA
jgi:deoxyribonuclease V